MSFQSCAICLTAALIACKTPSAAPTPAPAAISDTPVAAAAPLPAHVTAVVAPPTPVSSAVAAPRALEGADAPHGNANCESAALRWVSILATGNGWDAFNALAPEVRKRLSGTGQGDALAIAHILDGKLLERRAQGRNVIAEDIADRTNHSGNITLKYQKGADEKVQCRYVQHSWWIVADL
jgi:hypothetical protein